MASGKYELHKVTMSFGCPVFFDSGNLVILTNGFAKKSQKTPLELIALAEQRKKDYLGRKHNG
jgi:phage-related protein